jgi:hypothetical protein
MSETILYPLESLHLPKLCRRNNKMELPFLEPQIPVPISPSSDMAHTMPH